MRKWTKSGRKLLMILAKDFIETNEGLVFAVVESGTEEGMVLCFLRYIQSKGQWHKINTEQANHLLTESYPQYLYYSIHKDAHLHAVTLDKIHRHHKPRTRLNQLLANKTDDIVETDLLTLCDSFKKQGLKFNDVGVTGSVLIAAQTQNSDIDLVFYTRLAFNQARQITQELIQLGDCYELKEQDWKKSFDRRCCDLSYIEYRWHEKRKFNKALINQRKFDLSLVLEDLPMIASEHYKKLKHIQLKVQVTDDSLAFDYPAEFFIDHPEIKSIVSYTATYTGQAKNGEWVEVSGVLEESNSMISRIVVGSNREARGEFIKVINE